VEVEAPAGVDGDLAVLGAHLHAQRVRVYRQAAHGACSYRGMAALCRRLDGLPLAIELAASRIRSFGPAELVEHLDERFELLSAGARTAAPRHRTLRGAIDWSYELLDDDERALFDRLGVFPADFDFGAAQSVCGAGDSGRAVMRLLPRLVDKSLVSAAGSGTRRYRLLETIRSYAAERLAASGAGPPSGGSTRPTTSLWPSRLGDQRCAGRALLILGERAREQGQLGRAADLLSGSVAAITLAGQSIVLVTALEALAAGFSAQAGAAGGGAARYGARRA
jgi:hypothetical protein